MTKENNLWEVRYSERAKEDLKGIVDYRKWRKKYIENQKNV